jgi:hypothetical protein
VRKRKWEKPFLWKTARQGKVELWEVQQVVENLVLLGNDMAYQMMKEMVAANATEKEFCDAQNNWNRYLFNRVTPSSDGAPAPVSFVLQPRRSSLHRRGPSSATAPRGRKAT